MPACHPQRRERRAPCRRVVTAVASLLLLVLGAAPATAGADTGPSLGTNGAPVPQLAWATCPSRSPEEEEFLRPYKCATAEVPLSYRDPAGQNIELALGLLPATDPAHKIGTLFWNPGGPGVPGRFPPEFSELLRRRFDIVGFDPRGVGESTPIRCFTSNEQAFELLFWDFPITLDEVRQAIDLSRQATDLCAANGGPLLAHMSTADVARDLDLLRQAVGDPQLTYLGFSYGTFLGTVYANLFPDRVRAMALDAVLDPREWTGSPPADPAAPATYRIGSFAGTRRALETFLAACAADVRCAFREPGVDLRRKYFRLLARVRREPVDIVDESGTTTVTYQLTVNTTLGLLYDPAASTLLADGLQTVWLATEERAPTRLRVAGGAVGRAVVAARSAARWALPGAFEDEPYLGVEAFDGVLCTDATEPRNPWVWPRFARRADREGYPFGPAWVYADLPCATWPATAPDRYTGPWNRRTANPLLLVGNRLGDPATPYEDTRRVAERVLANARLLSVDTFGHTAFLQSACVVGTIERYLIEQRMPPRGAVCEPDRAPFDPPPEPPPGEPPAVGAVAGGE